MPLRVVQVVGSSSLNCRAMKHDSYTDIALFPDASESPQTEALRLVRLTERYLPLAAEICPPSEGGKAQLAHRPMTALDRRDRER
ncbi:Transcriptional regulator, GntR family (fragment) [Paraburkholderia piptadeniae]|uniref:Transcriptional regulator, GntR family n=1 Tax=Paraburkholderia piptadeniae TaxID=1701573 RepID=A0A1N7SMX4_9BURK